MQLPLLMRTVTSHSKSITGSGAGPPPEIDGGPPERCSGPTGVNLPSSVGVRLSDKHIDELDTRLQIQISQD
jgi:hypothetical protein